MGSQTVGHNWKTSLSFAYPTEPIIIRRISVRGGKEHTERIDEDGGREETRLMALKMEERGISSGVQVASRLWKIPSVDSALKPGKCQPCPHLDLISVGCFKPPSLWWFLTAAIRCQNCLIRSLRTLLRKTPRFPHLFYFLEISINEVSCFSRIPVSLVVFNHTGNKHLHFLHMTKECLVWTRKEIHYPWKEIVELMEKTKQSWRQGGTRFLLLKTRKPLYFYMFVCCCFFC